MPCSSLVNNLSALPVEVWSLISDYATAPALELDGLDNQKTCISSIRCTSHALFSLLTSEEYYQARVADAIKSLDELDSQRGAAAALTTSHWPNPSAVGGYKNLFQILASWSPLEGWYSLCDSWPWGYLVLFKFCDGMLCGEIINVTPEDGSFMSSLSEDACACQRKRIFEISFDSSGKANCSIIGKKAESFGVRWRGGENSSSYSKGKVKKSDVFRSLQIQTELSDEDVFPRNDGLLFNISDILKNEKEDKDINEPFFSEMSVVDDSIDMPMPTCTDIIETLLQREMPVYKYKPSERRPSYTERIQAYYPNGLLFEYLCGSKGRPLSLDDKERVAKDLVHSTHPLAPGFYAGRNNRYRYKRNLRNEIVQVRNHQLQKDCAETVHDIMISIQDSLKASKSDSLPSMADFVQSHCRKNVSLVSGRKVTGDIHVPTGELAFVAITSPVKNVAIFPTPPSVLVKGSRCHQVTNAWPCWKQLARPFYCDPSWKEGWLLELRGTQHADDDWGEGLEYCDAAQYAFWVPEDDNNIILSKLSCHFGSYLWED